MSDATFFSGSEVGRRMRALRLRRRLTLEQVAQLAGLTRNVVHQAEEVILEPRWSKVVAMAKALEIGLDQLACDRGAISDPDLLRAMYDSGLMEGE